MIDLRAENITIKYGEKIAVNNVSIDIEPGKITTIIGPNGSGKSTLIKALNGYLKPEDGVVYLNGQDILTLNKKEIAKNIATLPQIKTTTSDINVEDLVSYGRYPHLEFMKKLDSNDKKIVEESMESTGILKYKERYVETLSGGEKQRAWISMSLAQKPKILILDEPTTYLDISYQLEVLELLEKLNQDLNITIIMVLHDINQAARYSDHIYVLDQGQIYRHGKPEDIIEKELLKEIFRVKVHIYRDKINNCPYFIPYEIIKRGEDS